MNPNCHSCLGSHVSQATRVYGVSKRVFPFQRLPQRSQLAFGYYRNRWEHVRVREHQVRSTLGLGGRKGPTQPTADLPNLENQMQFGHFT